MANLAAVLADIVSRLSALIVFRAGPGSMAAHYRAIIGVAATLAAFSTTPLAGPFATPESLFGHGEVALQIALADVYCGQRNRMFPGGAMFKGLTEKTATTPLRQYIPQQVKAADLAAACKLVSPYSNFHEFSGSALMKAALALPPQDSPLTLMIKMRGIVVAAIVAAGALFAICRVGILPIFLSTEAAFILTGAIESIAWLDYYYLFPAALMLGVGVAAALGKAVVSGRPATLIGTAAAAAAVLVIIYNLRTTYGLALAAALILCGGAGALMRLFNDKNGRRRSVLTLCASLAAFFATAVAVDNLAFASFRNTDAAPEIAYHMVWHPVVLGLAVPGTEFTRAQGIEWNDSVGYAIAKRMNPNTTGYGLEYDALLKKYYFSLWRDHPREMLGAYLAKVEMFGGPQASMLKQLGDLGLFDKLRLRGFPLIILMIAGLAAMIAVFVARRRYDLAIFALASSAFLGGLGLEYIAVYTAFAPTHTAAGMLPFMLFEWCIVAAAAVWLRSGRSRFDGVA